MPVQQEGLRQVLRGYGSVGSGSMNEGLGREEGLVA